MNFKPWNDYSAFIRKKFGQRVQKISVNTGLGCPNMDGAISYEGCTYCNSSSFSPFYCRPSKSVSQQLLEGIDFFSGKYKAQEYLAYFQSYTNTYTSDKKFEKMINEALSVNNIAGLVIATRPDSISENKIKFLHSIAKNFYISLELGVESTLDKTLKRINRGHDFKTVEEIFDMCRDKNFDLCAHLILGLPGESKQEILSYAEKINKLKPDSLKLHHLQVLKNTAIAEEYKQVPDDFVKLDINDYINLIIDFLMILDPEIVIERFINDSPRELIISPDWQGAKNYYFIEKLRKEMLDRRIKQGDMYYAY